MNLLLRVHQVLAYLSVLVGLRPAPKRGLWFASGHVMRLCNWLPSRVWTDVKFAASQTWSNMRFVMREVWRKL